MKNIAILVLISFLAFAAAGVITLQTNCSFSNSTLYFTIKNIGNDTAYGVNVIPIFEGKEYTAVGKPNLLPGDSLTFKLPLQIAENGSYFSALSIGYSDSSGVPAFTLAHCIFSYGLPSPSFLLLPQPKLSFLGSGKYKLDISITNLGRTPINSTLFILLPLSFFSNASNFSFSLSPAQTKEFSVVINYKGIVQGVFEGIAFVPFSFDNEHFTSFVAFSLSTYQQQTNNLPIEVAVVIVVFLILLFVFLILKKRKVIK